MPKIQRNIGVRNAEGNHYYHIGIILPKPDGTVKVWGWPVRNTTGWRPA